MMEQQSFVEITPPSSDLLFNSYLEDVQSKLQEAMLVPSYLLHSESWETKHYHRLAYYQLLMDGWMNDLLRRLQLPKT